MGHLSLATFIIITRTGIRIFVFLNSSLFVHPIPYSLSGERTHKRTFLPILNENVKQNVFEITTLEKVDLKENVL